MNLINKRALLGELYQIITPEKVKMFDEFALMKTNHLTVVLENIYQDHNASAILRTCESLGIAQLHIIEKNNKFKVQRDIARGAGRWVHLDLCEISSNEPNQSKIGLLKNQGFQIVATSPHENGFSPLDLPIDKPIALIFGTELNGISEELKKEADCFLKIPSYGFTESLNVSVAVGIILASLRFRLEASQIDWKLNEEELIDLKIKWCEKIIPKGHLVVPEIERRLFQKD